MTLFLQATQDLRVGGRGSRTQYQYTLEDADLDELQTLGAADLRAAAQAARAARRHHRSADRRACRSTSTIDHDSARRAWASRTQAIDDTLYDAFGQRQVATSFTATNYYRVVLEATPEMLAGPGPAGARSTCAARSAASCRCRRSRASRPGPAPLSITHQGQFPATTISFNLAPDKSLGQAVQAIDAALRQIGMPASIHAGFKGTAQAFTASLDSEPWLILMALLVVYVVLGILYESLIHPLTILSTLPSAALGALIALCLFKLDFSIIALIGVVLLLGIVKKNAIMMIDFALEAERAENLDPKEAIRRACLLRFRPILMTTLAALFGAVPLADRVRRRLGAAPPARRQHRGRALPVAAPEPVHDAGDLPDARPAARAAPRARGRAAAAAAVGAGPSPQARRNVTWARAGRLVESVDVGAAEIE